MKHLLGLALLLTFVGGVLFFAPAGETNARSLMPQNDNTTTMRGDMQGNRHMRRHHRMRRHNWRRHHHRRHHKMMSNSNTQ